MAKEKIKPIKRSKELVPLSKDHHEGLLFGWKIKQGLRNGTDATTLAQFAQWFWQNDLQEHFRKEEQVLAPHLPSDNEFVVRMFREHKEIEALIHSVSATSEEAVFIQLADKIHDHIRFEERVLFPYAEKEIAPDDRKAIEQGLSDTILHSTKWENEFWVKKSE